MRAGVTVDALRGEAREGLGARLRDLDAAHRERIDHHDGAAGRGGQHRDARRARADRPDRRAAHQRQRLEQAFEAFDPRDAAIGEERARDIVLAGERAGMGDGKLARRRRAAELVGDDRLAALGGAEREVAQRRRIADAFEEQQVAVDVGIIERRGANLADRQVHLVADRDQPGKADAACALPRDISAPIMVPECEATKMRPTGMSGSAKAALAVSITPSRRLTTPRLDGPISRMPVSAATSRSRCSRATPVRAGLGKARRQDGGDLHAGTAAFGYRLDHGLGRHHHIGVIGRLRAAPTRLPGALAEHRVAARH